MEVIKKIFMKSDKKKILVLEDEKPLARAMELKLIHEGFDVVTATSGEDILSTLKNCDYSLIVSDLLMSKVDGFQVLKILKENNIKIPVIILTTLNQPEDEQKVRDLGAVEVFVKSETPIADVIARIKEMVG